MPQKKKKPSADGGRSPGGGPGQCVFCGLKEDNEEKLGKFIHKSDLSAHYFCLLFSSALVQRGKDTQGFMGFLVPDIKLEVKRGKRLRCSFCKHVGATVGCVVSSCRKAYHLGCGLDSGCLSQFCGNFSSFCYEHRPRQSGPTSDRLAFHGTAKTTCSICMSAVEARASDHTLRAPCCRNSWFHRSCVQKHAACAGAHFFKCPLCNNKEVFQKEMLQFGIYLPDQDAAWEQEPNAYQELLERHSRCDLSVCVCDRGREYHNERGKWHITLCRWCGAKGCHLACGGFKGVKAQWICDDCEESAAKLKPQKKKSPEKPKPKEKSPPKEKSSLKKKMLKLSKKEKSSKSMKSPSSSMDASGGGLKKRKRQEDGSNPGPKVKRHKSGSAVVEVPKSPSPVKKPALSPKKNRMKLTKTKKYHQYAFPRGDFTSPELGKKKKSKHSSLNSRKSPRFDPMTPRRILEEEQRDKEHGGRELRCLLREDIHTGANLGRKLEDLFQSPKPEDASCFSLDPDVSGDRLMNYMATNVNEGEVDFPSLRLPVSPGFSSIGVPSNIGSPRSPSLAAMSTTGDAICVISDDSEEEEVGNLDQVVTSHAFSGILARSTTPKPAWVRKLLNDDILTGNNLGSKFASQYGDMDVNLSRRSSRHSSLLCDSPDIDEHVGRTQTLIAQLANTNNNNNPEVEVQEIELVDVEPDESTDKPLSWWRTSISNLTNHFLGLQEPQPPSRYLARYTKSSAPSTVTSATLAATDQPEYVLMEDLDYRASPRQLTVPWNPDLARPALERSAAGRPSLEQFSVAPPPPLMEQSCPREVPPLLGPFNQYSHPCVPPLLGQSTAAIPPLLGQSTAAIPLLGQSTAAIPLLGQSTAAIPLLGQSTAAIPPLLGQSTAAIPLLGQSTAAIPPLLGQSTAAIPPLLGQSTAAIPPLLGQSTAAIPPLLGPFDQHSTAPLAVEGPKLCYSDFIMKNSMLQGLDIFDKMARYQDYKDNHIVPAPISGLPVDLTLDDDDAGCMDPTVGSTVGCEEDTKDLVVNKLQPTMYSQVDTTTGSMADSSVDSKVDLTSAVNASLLSQSSVKSVIDLTEDCDSDDSDSFTQFKVRPQGLYVNCSV